MKFKVWSIGQPLEMDVHGNLVATRGRPTKEKWNKESRTEKRYLITVTGIKRKAKRDK